MDMMPVDLRDTLYCIRTVTVRECSWQSLCFCMRVRGLGLITAALQEAMCIFLSNLPQINMEPHTDLAQKSLPGALSRFHIMIWSIGSWV